MNCNVLIADPEPHVREYLRSTLAVLTARFQDVTSSSELFERLGDGPVSLVVAGPNLAFPGVVTLIGMVRAAGVDTPFLVVDDELDLAQRQTLARVGNAMALTQLETFFHLARNAAKTSSDADGLHDLIGRMGRRKRTRREPVASTGVVISDELQQTG
jgi:hypothetical protein